MHTGIVADIKPDERCVALLPGVARTLVASGHRVLVETKDVAMNLGTVAAHAH